MVKKPRCAFGLPQALREHDLNVQALTDSLEAAQNDGASTLAELEALTEMHSELARANEVLKLRLVKLEAAAHHQSVATGGQLQARPSIA